jgi:hypothetical protein
MPDYVVTWEIDGDDAETPYEAASNAWHTMSTPGSEATVFVVSDAMGMATVVDLANDIETPAVWTPSNAQIADLAEYMAAEQWPVDEIITMIRRPEKYANEYTEMIVEREFAKVALSEEELDDMTDDSTDETTEGEN